MNSVKGLTRFSVVILSVALLFAFQNCSFTNSGLQSAGSNSSKSFGLKDSNGTQYEIGGEEGYEGKASYGARTPAGQCSDGMKYDTEVDVDHNLGVAVYTRYNCQDLPMGRVIASDSLNIMPHNLDNFSEGDKVYERTDIEGPAGELFAYCRGLTEFGDVMVDAVFRKTEDNTYFGRIVGGKYSESGALQSIRDSGYKMVKRWSSPNHPNIIYFSFYNNQGERELHISIKQFGITYGSMHYWIPPDNESWGSLWNFPCVRLVE